MNGKLIDDLEDHDLDVFSFNIKTFAFDNKLTPIMCTSFRCGSKSAFTGVANALLMCCYAVLCCYVHVVSLWLQERFYRCC